MQLRHSIHGRIATKTLVVTAATTFTYKVT